MSIPVIDRDGISYDECNIKRWLEKKNRSPTSSRIMNPDELVPNRGLQESIEQWKNEHQLKNPATNGDGVAN